MRVLVITYEFPPVGGGGGHIAGDLCQQLLAHGHQVILLTSHYKGLPYSENINGIQVHRVPVGRKLLYHASFLDMAGFVLSGTFHAIRKMRKWRPDIIHVHFAVPSGPVAWILSKIYHLPYVLTAHLGDVPGGVPEKTERWFKWVFPFTIPIWKEASRVVAVSEYTKQLAEKHYKISPEVIPNGIDVNALRPKQININNPPQIAFAGRFVPQKNLPQLLYTLSQIKELPWKCLLIGDGPVRPELEDITQTTAISKRVTFTGWITPDEVVKHLQQSDLLFMPSLSEGLPVVGVKAVATGLAVIASKVGGFLDLVENGVNGYLFDPDDTAAFAGAFRELLNDHRKLITFRQASLEIAKRFDIRSIAQRYEQILLEVLEEGSSQGSGES